MIRTIAVAAFTQFNKMHAFLDIIEKAEFLNNPAAWLEDRMVLIFSILGGLFMLAGIYSIGLRIMLYRKDPEKREKAMNQLIYVAIGSLIITIALTISIALTGFMEEQYIESASSTSINVNMDYESWVNTIEENQDLSLVYTVLEDLTDAVLFMARGARNFLFSEDMTLEEIIFNHSNFEINTSTPNGVDLYKRSLGVSGIILTIGIFWIGLRYIQSATKEDELLEAKEQIAVLIYAVALIITMPIIFEGMLSLSFALMIWLKRLVEQFGIYQLFSVSIILGGPQNMFIGILTFILIIIEISIFSIFKFREAVLLILYIIAPIAFAFWGTNRNFISVRVWLNLALKFMLLPMYYALALLVTGIMLNQLEIFNPLLAIMIYLISFKTVSIFYSMIQYKMSDGQIPRGGIGIAGMSMMLASTVTRSSIRKGFNSAGGNQGGSRQSFAQKNNSTSNNQTSLQAIESITKESTLNNYHSNSSSIANSIGDSNSYKNSTNNYANTNRTNNNTTTQHVSLNNLNKTMNSQNGSMRSILT